MRLLLLTPAELTRDPRARRAAAAARAAGAEVVGVCGQVSGEPPAPLEGVRIVRVGRSRSASAALAAGRAGPKRWRALQEARGLGRLAALAARTLQLLRASLRAGPIDVVHANDLDTLPAGLLVARRRHARLVYDAHELYTDFEPDPPRLYRAALSALERALARRTDAVVTVSEPLADELHRRLRLRDRPLVVLNAPELEPREPPPPPAGPVRAVYTGGFGSGRPLADLLAALERAPDVRLTLRVVQLPRELLSAEVARRGLDGRVEVAEPVSPERVVEALHAYDVGVIFDRPVTRNAELSLPNKLFEYLMAGLAVVAPRLPGMAPLLEDSGAAVLFAPGRPDELGAALEALALDRTRLAELRLRARAAARERFNAEAQAPALVRAWTGR